MFINNEHSLLQMYENCLDNVAVFYANLTWFYAISMIISWLAVIISWWRCSIIDKKQNGIRAEIKGELVSGSSENFSLQTQYKLAKQKLAEKKLTPEQRSMEKEAEAKQLAAILKLLQEQSETFQVSSMDQLENQLKLYRT